MPLLISIGLNVTIPLSWCRWRIVFHHFMFSRMTPVIVERVWGSWRSGCGAHHRRPLVDPGRGQYVRVVCRNFSIRMNRHVIENGDVLLFLDVYYYYCLLCHSLCWCSFSAGLKACTCSVIHSSHHSGSYTKHLPEDSCRSQHADLLDLCHSSSFWYFLDVFYHYYYYYYYYCYCYYYYYYFFLLSS